MIGDTIAVIIMCALGLSLPIILLRIEKQLTIADKYADEYTKSAEARGHITQYKIADKYEERAKTKVLDILNNLN